MEGRLKHTLIGLGFLMALGIGCYLAQGFFVSGVEAEMQNLPGGPVEGKPLQGVRDKIQAASDRTMGTEEDWKALRG